jgi:hypothetical protein
MTETLHLLCDYYPAAEGYWFYTPPEGCGGSHLGFAERGRVVWYDLSGEFVAYSDSPAGKWCWVP